MPLIPSTPRKISRKASCGVLFFLLRPFRRVVPMPIEPPVKRAIAFFDGQNLFYAVKQAFGYRWPNYDPLALARAVCGARGWDLQETYFYTGLPSANNDPFWKTNFLERKVGGHGNARHPHLLATPQIPQPDGQSPWRRFHRGVGGPRERHRLRIALNLVRMARENTFDVALIFSQDQDLSEVADEVKSILFQPGRGDWMRLNFHNIWKSNRLWRIVAG